MMQAETLTNNIGKFGGCAFINGTFMMSGGEISGNTAIKYGGGVVLSSKINDITILGGIFRGNKAKYGNWIFIFTDLNPVITWFHPDL